MNGLLTKSQNLPETRVMVAIGDAAVALMAESLEEKRWEESYNIPGPNCKLIASPRAFVDRRIEITRIQHPEQIFLQNKRPKNCSAKRIVLLH